MPRRRVLHPLRHIALVACLGLVSACQSARASGARETRAPDSVGTFDRISVSSTLDVRVVQGEGSHIELEGPSDALERVRIETRGGTLYLSREPERRLMRRTPRVTITVTSPKLEGVDVGGASELRFEGFEEETQMDILVSGASEVRGKVRGSEVQLSVSGASDVALSGSAERCELTASGASDAQLGGLACREYAVKLSGASDAHIYATRRLGPVKVSGASSLTYQGKPTMGSVSVSGAASVEKR